MKEEGVVSNGSALVRVQCEVLIQGDKANAIASALCPAQPVVVSSVRNKNTSESGSRSTVYDQPPRAPCFHFISDSSNAVKVDAVSLS